MHRSPGESPGEECSDHQWVVPILESFCFEPTEISRRIHPADEMFEQAVLEQGGDVDGGTAAYYASGAQIARTVERLFGEKIAASKNVSSGACVLDFGCGFGRVTRFLGAVFGSEHVWASDLIEGAVQFQREHLDCSSFVSSVDPADVEWPEQRFDLIYVGSLFTHLPESTFGLWLDTLFSRVAEGGTLLFSVHDEALKPAHVPMPESGLAFVAQSEARDIEHDVYGSAWVSSRFVEERVDALTAEAGVVWYRYPRALCGYQDLIAVSKRRRAVAEAKEGAGGRVAESRIAESRKEESGFEADLNGEAGRPEPVVSGVGQIDSAELIGSKHSGAFALRLGGWALPTGWLESTGRTASIEAADALSARICMQLFAGERRVLAESTCDAERGDLAELSEAVASVGAKPGWSLDLELPDLFSRGGDLLLVTASWGSAVGEVRHVLFAGSVDRLLLQVTDEQYRRRRDRVFELAETIDQVKESSFWRLRRMWFRVKNRLGWTTEDPDGPVLKQSDRRGK